MRETAAAFDELSAEFFPVWLRYHPDLAVEAGVKGYEHLLPAQSDDELAALAGWLETLVVALEELDYQGLDRERQIDLRLMFGAARVEHRELLVRDWRHRDPLRFLPVGEIDRLTLQPTEDLRSPLVRLLESIPEYLRLALAHLRPMAELIPPQLVSAAVHEAGLGRCYLRDLVRSPWLRHSCGGLSDLESLTDQACAALATFADGLRGDVAARAAGRLGCGEKHLRFLLRHRHFIASDPSRVRDGLAGALESCEEELAEACRGLRLRAGDAWDHLRTRRVARRERLGWCRRESKRLESFLRSSGLFDLPEASLRVAEWSPCPRPQRLGFDYVPDREARIGRFFLRTAGAADSGDEPRSLLRASCLTGAWGGSHLLAFTGGDLGSRLPRRLCSGGGFAAAWELYLRRRLCELGYLDEDDCLLGLLQRKAAIESAILDFDLHSGLVGAREAGERMATLPVADSTDLVYLARHPGTAVAGVLGWLDMETARAEHLSREGADFDDARFHGFLLGGGPIPPALVLSSGIA